MRIYSGEKYYQVILSLYFYSCGDNDNAYISAIPNVDS